MKSASVWAETISKAAQASAKEQAAHGPEQPPAELTGLDLDLWLVEREIIETRAEIHRMRMLARAGGTVHGLAGLGARFDQLLNRRAQLRPPPKKGKDEEELEWRATADRVLRLIETGVAQAEKRLGGEGEKR